ATANGDSSIQSARVVTSVSRYQALGVISPGDMVTGPNGTVDVIQVNGSFSGGAESAPAGVSPAPGTVLTIAVNATTYQVDDWSLNTTAPDISSLGSVVTISS
ncbi:MAG: hypothetical protein ACYDBS_01745, partial [Acidimicrobiales bacterium]